MFVFDLPILRFTSRFALAYEELEIFIAIIWTSEKDVAGEFPQRVQQSVNEGIQIPHEVHFAVLLHLATENAHLGLMIRQIPEELVVLLPYKAELLLPILCMISFMHTFTLSLSIFNIFFRKQFREWPFL